MSKPKYINPSLKTLEPIKEKSQIIILAIEDKKDNFARTSVLQSGFSIYNALLQICDNNYVNLTESDKISSADELRRKITSKLNKQNVDQSTSVINKLNMEKNIKFAISAKYKNPESTTLSLVFEIFKLEDLITIVEDVFDDDKSISVCKSNFLQKVKNHFNNLSIKLLKDGVEKVKIDRCIEKLNETLDKIVDKASDSVSVKVVENKFDIDVNLLKFLSRKMNVNIYIFSGDDRLPKIYYNGDKFEKSVVLLQLGAHYEIIGRIMKEKVITREFSESDPILDKFRLCINDVSYKKLFQSYPELKKMFDIDNRNQSLSESSNQSSTASPNDDD